MSDISRRLTQVKASLRQAADAHLKPAQPPLKKLSASVHDPASSKAPDSGGQGRKQVGAQVCPSCNLTMMSRRPVVTCTRCGATLNAKPRTYMKNIDIQGVAGVDHPAHQAEGWLLMKSESPPLVYVHLADAYPDSLVKSEDDVIGVRVPGYEDVHEHMMNALRKGSDGTPSPSSPPPNSVSRPAPDDDWVLAPFVRKSITLT